MVEGSRRRGRQRMRWFDETVEAMRIVWDLSSENGSDEVDRVTNSRTWLDACWQTVKSSGQTTAECGLTLTGFFPFALMSHRHTLRSVQVATRRNVGM